MRKIFEGLHRFRSDVFTAERELFERLAKGQNPELLFITCSDSRIVPNMVTQTPPGSLFILRNAGNIVPPFGQGELSQAGTIEFAVTKLGVKDIVVCGHSHCGAVKGLLDPSILEDAPLVKEWLRFGETTRRIITENYQHLSGAELQRMATQANILVQLNSLKTHPSVASKLAQKAISLHGWYYEFETGEVTFYHPERERFVRLDDESPTAAENGDALNLRSSPTATA